MHVFLMKYMRSEDVHYHSELFLHRNSYYCYWYEDAQNYFSMFSHIKLPFLVQSDIVHASLSRRIFAKKWNPFLVNFEHFVFIN